MSKYDPLTSHLRELHADRWRARFSELERVLGFRLPESAPKYPAWWASDPRQGRQCMAWISAGWRTEDLDLGSQAVLWWPCVSGGAIWDAYGSISVAQSPFHPRLARPDCIGCG